MRVDKDPSNRLRKAADLSPRGVLRQRAIAATAICVVPEVLRLPLLQLGLLQIEVNLATNWANAHFVIA